MSRGKYYWVFSSTFELDNKIVQTRGESQVYRGTISWFTYEGFMNVGFLVKETPLNLWRQLFVTLIADDVIRPYCDVVDGAIGLFVKFFSSSDA